MLSSIFLHVGGMYTLVLPVSSDSSSSSRLCARSRGRSRPGRQGSALVGCLRVLPSLGCRG